MIKQNEINVFGMDVCTAYTIILVIQNKDL